MNMHSQINPSHFAFGCAPDAREAGYDKLMTIFDGSINQVCKHYAGQDVAIVEGCAIASKSDIKEYGIFARTPTPASQISGEIQETNVKPQSPAIAVADFPSLTAGKVDQEHFDLLLSNTSTRGEKVIAALQDHLVYGLSAKEATDKNEVNPSQFYKRLTGLQESHKFVCQIMKFYI